MKLSPMLLPWSAFARLSVRLGNDSVPITSLEPRGSLGLWFPVPISDFHVESLIIIECNDDAWRIAAFHAAYLPCYARRAGRVRRTSLFSHPVAPRPDLAWLIPIVGRSNRRDFRPPFAFKDPTPAQIDEAVRTALRTDGRRPPRVGENHCPYGSCPFVSGHAGEHG